MTHNDPDRVVDDGVDFDELVDCAISWLVGEWGWDTASWPSTEARRERTADRLRYEGANEAEVQSLLRGWSRFDSACRTEAIALAASVARDPRVDALTRMRASAASVFDEDTEPGTDVDDEIKTSRENAA